MTDDSEALAAQVEALAAQVAELRGIVERYRAIVDAWDARLETRRHRRDVDAAAGGQATAGAVGEGSP